MLRFGTSEFFNHLKDVLNSDKSFRKLGKGVYTTTELIYLKDLNLGVWQKTTDGKIDEFLLIPKKELSEKEREAEIIYYVRDYDSLLSMLRGEDSFVALVIDGTLEFKGSMKRALQIQAASDRMEVIVKKTCNESVMPTKIQFQKWAAGEGYL
ncbi:MAG: hypothetical protein M1386_02650 [Candidatus Thermoplasmatota archaeon]|jgi:negative regulator of genetic competence, sporulation and motility|nr:hypothetical protein [Candidatus Thermoplasmatota archaeon]